MRCAEAKREEDGEEFEDFHDGRVVVTAVQFFDAGASTASVVVMVVPFSRLQPSFARRCLSSNLDSFTFTVLFAVSTCAVSGAGGVVSMLGCATYQMAATIRATRPTINVFMVLVLLVKC